MSKRQGFVVSRKVKAESPLSPNAVVPAITVELRVHWPARMGHEPEVLHQIEAALIEARAALRTHTDPPTERDRIVDEQREHAPAAADSVQDLPWFDEAREQAENTLAATPEHSWPSWYREYRRTDKV